MGWDECSEFKSLIGRTFGGPEGSPLGVYPMRYKGRLWELLSLGLKEMKKKGEPNEIYSLFRFLTSSINSSKLS